MIDDADLSWYTEVDNGYGIVEQLRAGAPTGARITFPIDAAPYLAHAILDVWSDYDEGEEDE